MSIAAPVATAAVLGAEGCASGRGVALCEPVSTNKKLSHNYEFPLLPPQKKVKRRLLSPKSFKDKLMYI